MKRFCTNDFLAQRYKTTNILSLICRKFWTRACSNEINKISNVSSWRICSSKIFRRTEIFILPYDLLVLITLKITFYHILNISHVPRFHESQCSRNKNHIKNSTTLNISHVPRFHESQYSHNKNYIKNSTTLNISHNLPQNRNFHITLRSFCSNKNHIKNHILPHSKYITYSMNHNVHEVEKKRKFNRSFIKHLISSPHPLSLFLCPGNSDVDNDVVGCRLIRAMANRGKCHVVTRNNLQRGSNVLSLFFFFLQYLFDVFFFTPRWNAIINARLTFLSSSRISLTSMQTESSFFEQRVGNKEIFFLLFFFLHLNRS